MKQFLIILAVLFLTAPLFAVTLKPENVEQFFVAPDTESIIRFQIVGDGKTETAEFRLSGAETKTIPAVIDGNIISATVNLSRGFWELELDKQRFGIVSLPAFKGKPDKFFAIDGALSWLVRDDQLRNGLVKSAKRNGITMIRERLSWNDIESKPNQFQWETGRRYDSVRKLCKEQGIEILDVFHNAPNWMDTIEKYPSDLVKTAKSWNTVANYWNTAWGGFEIWNEPEIGFGAELPADQYVPMARAIAYQLKQSNIPTPLFGGVMSHFHPIWLKNAAENGLLHDVDGFSFHSYDHAPSLEKLIGNYRNFLKESGYESIPLWLTECGHAWKRGTERPLPDQDLVSAVDITMKGVESRCCGVERYFPFVYPYYDEREKNFGMTDKLGTPCRSIAAYIQLIHVLSGSEYVGDLKIEDSAVLRTRVFEPVAFNSEINDRNELVTVLYTGTLPQPKSLKLPSGNIKKVESLFGEPLKLSDNGELLIRSNSLYYIWFDKASIVDYLKIDTNAMKLYQSAKKPRKRNDKIPAVVLRFQYDKEKLAATPDGYFISLDIENPLPMKFRVFNLDQNENKYNLRFEIGSITETQNEVVVGGHGFADVIWNLPLEKIKISTGELQKLRVTVNEAKNRSLVLNLRGEATWDGVMSGAKNVYELPINDLSRWQKNAPPICISEIECNDNIWRMTATFNKEGDRWVYPRLKLPDDVNLSNASGIIVEARCNGDALPRFFLFEESGAGYINGPIFKSDGNWHVIKLSFTQFQHAGATRPDENNQLDLDRVNFISLGVNSKESKCVLEIKKIVVYSN
ncbi:MAG: glycoside hydrolase family 5 protein [Planctomycetaceae bacterium]|nr:glycoside hydrolase family 5 protein [Planctomycetaceae bacterium]